MINSFGTLYQGQVNMEGVGYDGISANDRRYPNDKLIETFGTATEVAKLVDRLGYDIFWMAEHHFQHEGYECIPNILMLSLHLASLTKDLKFGCGFNISPMWHPLRLAEDYATADILTKGRIVFGLGRGYHSREVETFGMPMLDTDANRELFEEQFEVIMKAFNEESFSHHGKHYDIPPNVPYRGYDLEEITLVPRPVNPVEVWQPLVSGNPRGVGFMVKNNIKAVISATAEDIADNLIHMYQDTATEQGKDLALGENISLGYRFYIAETREKAMKEAQPFFEEHAKFAAPLGMLRYSPEQMQQIGNISGQTVSTMPTIEDGVNTGVWLCGPPEDFIAYFKNIEQKYPGVNHIMMGASMGMTRDVFTEQLEIFAKEVMPHFKK